VLIVTLIQYNENKTAISKKAFNNIILNEKYLILTTYGTYLHNVCLLGNITMTKYLIEHGVSIDKENDFFFYDEIPLFFAYLGEKKI